jgi:hypothetical protein
MRLRLLLSCCGILMAACDRQPGATRSGPLSQEEMKANIKRDAGIAGKALLSRDYDTYLKYVPRRLIDSMGGNAGMRRTFEKRTAEMEAQGTGFHDVTIGEPESIRDFDGNMVGFVPEHIVMKVPEGKLHSDSWILGLSGNGGRNWVFIDMGVMSSDKLGLLYPELAGKVEMRSHTPPVLKPD